MRNSGIYFIVLGLIGCATSTSEVIIGESTAVQYPSYCTVLTNDLYSSKKSETLPASECTQEGYDNVYKACVGYFDVLIHAKNENKISSDIISSANKYQATILAALSTATPAIAVSTSVIGFIGSIFESFDKNLLIPYPDETKSLILAALAAHKQLYPPSKAKSDGEAREFVQMYAEMCTYSGISRFSRQALQNAKPKIELDDKQTMPVGIVHF